VQGEIAGGLHLEDQRYGRGSDETAFWLELMSDAGIVSRARLKDLLNEANELVRIFAASRTTAKSR
jgi:hypothetical protein